ncbi:ParB N-terminal domain-containing protein [Cyanobacteria bacterium FACHB-502]|uniref:ParB/RepB/Spo0J family partition protein n=1 Tax=Leptolyngbya sp. GB1-A1 TaxID=2933908 RepID=UPI0019C5D6B2|nr:ParB N-terminal domain-containing protein [Cyanobacteria bacterium FACHB-502]
MSKPRKIGSALHEISSQRATSPSSSGQSGLIELTSLIKQAEVAKEQQAADDQSGVEKLQQELEAIGGKYKVELRLIDPDPHQPRKTFPKSVIEERAQSLTRNGQLSPIILIPQPNGRYVLFEGELRYRAATYLKWNSLDAVFLPIEVHQAVDADRFQKQMLTSAHAQRLHDLDLAEGILRLVELRYPEWAGRSSNLPRILNTVITRLKRTKQIDNLKAIRNASIEEQQTWIREILAEDERPVFQVILGMQYNPETISRTAFPLLTLTDDLKDLVRSTGLESSKIKELQKLNAKNLGVDEDKALEIRSQVAQEAVETDLSLSEIKIRVAQTLQQHTTATTQPQISPAIKKVQSIPVVGVEPEELRNLKEALLEKAKEIETHLSNL